MKKKLAIIIALIPLATAALVVDSSAFLANRFEPDKYGNADYDVTYCSMDGVDLGMDLPL